MFHKGYLSSRLLIFSFLINICCLSGTVNATKHLFRTKNDRRYIIAPIGEPFGFVKGGSISLTINDYEMTETKSMSGKDKKSKGKGGTGFFSSGRSSKESVTEENSGTSSFHGVFMLKRFETESEFRRFVENTIDDPTQCLYQQFRNDRNGRKLFESFDDDDTNLEYYDIAPDDDEMPYYGHFDDLLVIMDDDMVDYGSNNYFDIYGVDDMVGDNVQDDDAYYQYLIDKDDIELDDELPTDDTFIKDLMKPRIPAPDVANDGIFLSMRDKALWRVPEGEKGAPALQHTFKPEEEGLYVLIYQVCPTSETPLFSQVRSSFKIKLQTQNIDALGRTSFLTAGERHLPIIFFFFSVSYLVITYCWNTVLKGGVDRKDKVNVKAVHHLMTVILILKAISMLFESIRYHFISVKGHAEFWSFLFYSITFVKSILLFAVILLLGSGWSLVRPFLHQREKIIVFLVLILQTLNNIAVIFILSDTEGENAYKNWLAFSHLVDIMCCCLVLLPVVWQVSTLEGQSETEESARTLKMLKLFRAFYLVVITWVYFTRVVVFLLSTVLPYRLTWVSPFLTEIGSIVFFLLAGYYFRPEARENISLEMKSSNEINRDDAEYGDVEPLFDSGEVAIPGSKLNID